GRVLKQLNRIWAANHEWSALRLKSRLPPVLFPGRPIRFLSAFHTVFPPASRRCSSLSSHLRPLQTHRSWHSWQQFGQTNADPTPSSERSPASESMPSLHLTGTRPHHLPNRTLQEDFHLSDWEDRSKYSPALR